MMYLKMRIISARFLFYLLLYLLIGSCEKDVTIPIPEGSSKVVLNLLMNKDSIMMARVTLSGRLNGIQPMPEVTNAAVNLYENGAFKETLSPYLYAGRTYYRGNTLAKAGNLYRITALVPDRGEVSGSDQVPDTAAMGDMSMTVAEMGGGQSKTTISVQLHDDPAAQNYYRLRLYRIYEWMDSTGNGGRQKVQQYFEAEDTEWALFGDKTGPEFYITDALFNGHSPRFTFRADTYGAFQQMAIEITSLTYNSYNYLNSAFLAAGKNEDGLAEKVIVYNNIINGLGIIGGVAQREYVVTR